MNACSKLGRGVLFAAVWVWLGLGIASSIAQSITNGPVASEIRIVDIQGEVEVSPVGAVTWVLTRTNQVLYPQDRLRTAANSRVAIRWSDRSVVRFGPSTELEILPPHRPDAQAGLYLVRGVMSFFHRDQPGRIRVITRGAVAGVEGTEFVLAVETTNGTERATLSVIDGRVQFGQEPAMLVLTNGQQAVAEPGRAPVSTAGFVANHVLQWCFYYPAVLDLAELPLSPAESNHLAGSLAAYRAGDLPAALELYPAVREPGSDPERVYYAALLLSVGEVARAETLLSRLGPDAAERPRRLANSLRQLVAAVKRQPTLPIFNPRLATEALANSYFEQSLAVRGFSLEEALRLARQAADRSPEFGFAWARVAELEFGFGRANRAMAALDRSLGLAPRNAQSLALRGFLLAARNESLEAITWFDRALAQDAALGNAWLGRGLCRIRRGDLDGGREDLLVAAALEPQRADLRSYLGKAYAAAGDYPRAVRELQLARELDPNDPTAWLYSALLQQEHSRINPAIRDLEKSQDLNDNRSVYRSQLLLDQDRAVRSANLAGVYRDADMADVSAREAARAVNNDYGNYSAHLFLADSFHQLGDPNLVNLRFETAAETEYLLANLLAPASAGTVSPTISQQEYSRLFERDRLGVVSTTEYLSRGAWTEAGAQYGTFDNFSYELGAFYRSDNGQRVNNDLEQRQLSVTLKQQITPQDMIYVQAVGFKSESGDLTQYYDPDLANPGVRVKEKQEPLLGVGFHHEWSPGVHTLFLAARLADTLTLTNPDSPTMIFVTETDGSLNAQELQMRGRYEGDLEIYSAEAQQIWQQPTHNTILGARFQYGEFETATLLSDPSDFWGYFPDTTEPPIEQDVGPRFKRFSVYGYHQWQVADPLQLTAGLTYDWMILPENFQTVPVSTGTKTMDQISPKAGLIWTPTVDTTLRFAYTRSLGGASLDQSYRLEPSQVAGMVQSFRSLIPESVAGPTSGAKFETVGLSLEQKFSTGTYLGVSGELLYSKVNRVVGAFDGSPPDTNSLYAVPSGLRQNLDFREQSLLLTANQLVGKEWSFGARYRLSQSVLKENFVDLPDSPGMVPARERPEGILHQLALSATFNHRSGVFAKAETWWFSQSNRDALAFEPGDDFWQFNALAGYRFLRRRAEASVGVLNLTDQDYRLDPINRHPDLPRSRTLVVRFQLGF